MKHERIETETEANWNACLRALSAALDAAERMPSGRAAIGEALCAALETVGGGSPSYPAFGDMRETAAFWADTATPIELEIYAAAALRRIERATFAKRARKRVFWAMWQGMSAQDRAAFKRHLKEAEPP